MSVKFQIDSEKIIATVLYIASKNVPELTPAKLFKLMFLAEKYHLVRYGRPITGDRYDAMKDGPVPSFTYGLFRKQILKAPFTSEGRCLASSLLIDRSYTHPRIAAQCDFDREQLSPSDIAALDRTIDRYGSRTFSELRSVTHNMMAYGRAWAKRGKKDAAPMEFEQFFEEDEDALVGVKEEMLENHILNTVFAKPR
jgi:uncharacterized phage-associated protein